MVPIKIKKILNNNAVIVLDEGKEKVVVGSGIAFNRKRNDLVLPQKIEKIFVMKENDKLAQLLSRIPEEHFTISEEIITYAEKALHTKLSEHIHVVLTDHISFAIERTRDGIHIQNKLLHEIKLLYAKEFEIGIWAIQHIQEVCKITMPQDEAAFIALHLHTMKPQGGNLRLTLLQTTMVRDMVQSISKRMDIPIEEDDISYQRLITHLRQTLERLDQYEIHTLDEEMSEMIRKKYPHSYKFATAMAKDLLQLHGVKLPEQELGYITVHIERLRKAEKKFQNKKGV